MREKEPEIERRIAVMTDLKIDQHQAIVIDEQILRTEVAMHQTMPLTPHRVDQPFDRRRKVGMHAANLTVIRIQTQIVEKLPVVQLLSEIGVMPRPGVQSAQ